MKIEKIIYPIYNNNGVQIYSFEKYMYVSLDGIEFEDKNDCVEYENKLRYQSKI